MLHHPMNQQIKPLPNSWTDRKKKKFPINLHSLFPNTMSTKTRLGKIENMNRKGRESSNSYKCKIQSSNSKKTCKLILNWAKERICFPMSGSVRETALLFWTLFLSSTRTRSASLNPFFFKYAITARSMSSSSIARFLSDRNLGFRTLAWFRFSSASKIRTLSQPESVSSLTLLNRNRSKFLTESVDYLRICDQFIVFIPKEKIYFFFCNQWCLRVYNLTHSNL